MQVVLRHHTSTILCPALCSSRWRQLELPSGHAHQPCDVVALLLFCRTNHCLPAAVQDMMQRLEPLEAPSMPPAAAG